MKRAIILHGRPRKAEYYDEDYPSPSNSYWLPWLQRQLLRSGIEAQTPEIKQPYTPRYENWGRAIEYFKPDQNTMLIGHSCGAGMIVQWLSKNPDVQVDKVVLVAPWIDVEKNDWPAFDFEIDSDIASRTKSLTMFHSKDDVAEIQSSVKLLRRKLANVNYVEFDNMGHFTHKYLTNDTFPELLKELLS